MIADLAGEDFERFYRASGSHQSRYMTIHTDRGVWQFAPRLGNIAPEELAEISRDNGWFIFTMIRDPWTRLWSAWQSKFLVQHTPYVREYRDEPWFPRVPSTPADVVADWAGFVAAKPWETHELLKADSHFMTQFSSARPHGVNYSRIYDITEMSLLEADIHAHLGTLGLDQDLYLLRTNENPVSMPIEALENGVADIVRAAYEIDVAEWGDRWDLDKIKGRLGPIGMDEVRSVSRLVSANERIGDLSRELKRSQRRVASVQARRSGATRTGSQPPSADGVATTPSGPPVGFTELLRAYPWPRSPRYPDVEPPGHASRGFELVTDATVKTRNPVILEIGAGLGASTRRSLAIPGSYVVSIDPWRDRQSFEYWPALRQFKGVSNAAHDLFRSFNFQYRDRLVAVRGYSPRALIVVQRAGLRPDIVYIDGDHRTAAVLRDITVAAALFPEATICGAGWARRPKQQRKHHQGGRHPIRAAVIQWAAFRDHFVDTRQNTWLLDANRKFNLRDPAGAPAAQEGDAAPKQAAGKTRGQPRSTDQHERRRREQRPARTAIGRLQSAARRSLNRDP